MLSRHLAEDFNSTAYSINVYVIPGPQSVRLSRLSRADLEKGAGQRITCTFIKRTNAKARRQSTKGKSPEVEGDEDFDIDEDDGPSNARPKPRTEVSAAGSRSQAKRKHTVVDDEDEVMVEDSEEDFSADIRAIDENCVEYSDEEDWAYSLAEVAPAKKRARTSGRPADVEIVDLSRSSPF
jgi:ATP-dependent DNA helicase Q1